MSKRLARLNEQLKREISGLLRTGVRDPRVGVVTVTGVDTVSDLAVARVFVRIMGDPAERKETMEGLEAAAPFIRTELGKELHIRRVPELRFQQDRSLEHAQRIEEILQDVLPEGDDADDDAGPDGPVGTVPSETDGEGEPTA
ncbi:MAG: 30S ribosome-binding factor RbfA [Longimicrobiales bacterium]